MTGKITNDLFGPLIASVKHCKDCNQFKPLEEFFKAPKTKTGRASHCKVCFYNRYDRGEKYQEHQRQYGQKSRLTVKGRAYCLWNMAKRRAIVKNESFTLTFNKVYTVLMFGLCERTGISFDLSPNKLKGARNKFAPSVDRIDSFDGYHDGNCQIVVDIYNRGKHQSTDEEFADFCRRYVAHLEGRAL